MPHLRDAAHVSVVMPYFEQPDTLLRMFGALLADPALDQVDVVVVDDGSRQPPPSPPAALADRVTMLRQDDRGCRPAAARNLGAAHAAGDVLVFLDPDTLPEPGTIHRLARWPATVADALVVGHRYHGDLDGWTGPEVTAWLRGQRPPPVRRRDPEWLDDAYRDSADLRDVDHRSYRFVISGIMACDRILFDDLGGFDPDRVGYGGEDWELASRAYAAGAVLVHDPTALAWHDEPDVGDRPPTADKNEETLWLATRLTDPCARPSGLCLGGPRWTVAVDLPPGLDPAHWIVTVDGVLRELPDAAVTLSAQAPADAVAAATRDARVTCGPPPEPSPPSAVAHVTVAVPFLVDPGGWADALRHLTARDLGTLELVDGAGRLALVTSNRPIGRARRAARRGIPVAALPAWPAEIVDLTGRVQRLGGPIDLARYFGQGRP